MLCVVCCWICSQAHQHPLKATCANTGQWPICHLRRDTADTIHKISLYGLAKEKEHLQRLKYHNAKALYISLPATLFNSGTSGPCANSTIIEGCACANRGGLSGPIYKYLYTQYVGCATGTDACVNFTIIDGYAWPTGDMLSTRLYLILKAI